MALSNVAVLLSQWGSRVLVVDWDLEAPGIERYLEDMAPGIRGKVHDKDGIIEIVDELSRESPSRWRESVIRFPVPGVTRRLDFLSAGRRDSGYVERLQRLDWEALFRHHDFGSRLEVVRNEWMEEYDYVLIDSRTGITDIGGICTIYLPDVIVAMFSANYQSIEGVADVITRARRARSNLPVDRGALVCIPVPCRDESRTEYRQSLEWRNIYHETFSNFYVDFLPKNVSAVDALDLLRIPNVPFWSFGERLPVLTESASDPSAITYYYAILARLLATDLSWQDSASSQAAAFGEAAEVVPRRQAQPASGRVQIDGASRPRGIDVSSLEQMDEIHPGGGKYRWPLTLGRHGRSDSLSLSQQADHLAAAVSAQWSREVAVRRLNDPYPLPVSWAAADPSLSDSWDVLATLANRGAGWPSPLRNVWASGPGELAGEDDELASALALIPTGRLLVLGEPGSGKTSLMVRLVLDLLARRVSGGPVAVLVSMASWNPAEEGLHSWLAAQLAASYSLASPEALLAAGMILPILDGLDEISESMRGLAITHINDELRPGEQVVVACRRRDYLLSASAGSALRATAAIELRPLSVHDVSRYLIDDAGIRAARWDPVLKSLGTSTPVGQALTTPLMVSLARFIYNPRPGELTESVPEPAELLDADRFPDLGHIKEHLFDAFITAAYQRGSGSAGNRSLTAGDARRWLTFLARTPGLAWWRLPEASPVPLIPLAVAAVCGIAVGIATPTGSRWGIGPGVGILVGVAVGLLWKPDHTRLATGITGGLAGGLVGGLAAGLAGTLGFGYATSLTSGLPAALSVGFGVGACTSFNGGLVGGIVGGFAASILEGVGKGPIVGLVSGLGIALAVAIFARFYRRHTPAVPLIWTPFAGIVGGLFIGLAVGVIVWPLAGIVPGLAIGGALGIATAWLVGLTHSKTDTKAIPSPHASLTRDTRTFWTAALAPFFVVGAFALAAAGLAVFEANAKLNLSLLVSYGLGTEIMYALVAGLIFGIYQSASPSFLISHIWLSLLRKVPWQYMRFLADAQYRGILHQNGEAYEFRYTELREHLARHE